MFDLYLVLGHVESSLRTLRMKHRDASVLGRRSTAERARARSGIVLRDSIIKPRTLEQYYRFGKKLLPLFRAAKSEQQLDDAICTWIEQAWSKGKPLYHVSTALCGVQFFCPGIRGKIPESWKLFRVWRRLEVPSRAPLMAQEIVFAIAALAIFRGDLVFGALILAAFEGLLRTGEMLSLCGSDLLIRNGQGLIRLANAKTSGRKGVTEVVTLHHPWVLMVQILLEYLQEKNLKFAKIWQGSPSVFRQRFKEYCKFFKLQRCGFRPYSLRRGGATHLFQQSLSYDLVLDKGRWSSVRAAKLYIMDGLSKLPHLSLHQESLDLISAWAPF